VQINIRTRASTKKIFTFSLKRSQTKAPYVCVLAERVKNICEQKIKQQAKSQISRQTQCFKHPALGVFATQMGRVDKRARETRDTLAFVLSHAEAFKAKITSSSPSLGCLHQIHNFHGTLAHIHYEAAAAAEGRDFGNGWWWEEERNMLIPPHVKAAYHCATPSSHIFLPRVMPR
jgi:HrpA-like RNA helicase